MLRKTVLALVVLALSTSVAEAQQWAEKMFGDAKMRTHNFGHVARASKTQHRFVFKNLYKEDLHVLSLRASCGCATPTVSRRTIKSLESGEVLINFNTRAFLGQKNATITVVFDKPYYAEVRLEISGYIRSDLVFDPPVVDFGNVDVGATAQRKIKVQFAGRSDWVIRDITSANSHFEVEKSQPVRKGNRTTYELTVRLKDDAPAGYVKDHLTLVTNDRSSTRVPLYVEGRVVPSLSVSPAQIAFGSVKQGSKVVKMMIVRGKTPFKVTAVDSDDECFTFDVDHKISKLHKIPVTFTAGDKPGKIEHTIHIKTDQGDDIEVECQALAKVVVN